MIVPGPLFALMAVAAAPTGAAPPAESSPAMPRKICREAAANLGSRIKIPRRCRTVEQWQEEDQAKSGLPLSAQITEGQGDALQKQRPQ